MAPNGERVGEGPFHRWADWHGCAWSYWALGASVGSDRAAGLRLNYELPPHAGSSSLSLGQQAWGLQAAAFLSSEGIFGL